MGSLLSDLAPFPSSVKAITTLRSGGLSRLPYRSFNLGNHVGDSAVNVAGNRELLQAQVVPAKIQWLSQVHGESVVINPNATTTLEADAIWLNQTGIAAAIMTADCLPVLLSSSTGDEVAAVHCGWRGLTNNLLSKIIKQFSSPPQDLITWLGPAIGPCHFEVGMEVIDQIGQKTGKADSAWFSAGEHGKAMVDLHAVATRILANLGVSQIFSNTDCTYCAEQKYFSYRRDRVTGRMASLIWIEP